MDKSEIAKILGKAGGKENVRKHGKERMKRISQLGVEAKRRKKQESAPGTPPTTETLAERLSRRARENAGSY